MKHTIKIVAVLLGMFLLAQIIGLLVVSIYASQDDNIPYGMNPPKDIAPQTSLLSIIIAIALGVGIMLFMIKFKVELFLRLWFLFVVIIALAISLNAFIFKIPYAQYIALAIAIPLGLIKVFQRNIFVHNITEVLIYPGIAAIFVPLLNIWTISLLLILISVYDIYAVWHAGFMQEMAKYQITQLKVFSGFFVPYIGKKEKELIQQAKLSKSKSRKKLKIKVNLAILGGGDVVFPIIFSGVILRSLGLIPALIATLGALGGLAFLFYISKKGKFYPAMPFISAGCFVGLAIAYLVA